VVFCSDVGALRLPRLVVALAAAAALLTSLAPAAGAKDRAPRSSPHATATPGLSVQGNQLYADGAPFVGRGVQIVGLVAPKAYLWGKYIAAGQHFGAAELRAAVADHANLVRFQVSEYGLDPDNAEYSAAYVQQVKAAVQTARSLGMYAIVSLQSESAAGQQASGHRCPLPDAGALTDWNELAGIFASDPGVMFELYNEPGLPATANGWSYWLSGGSLVTGDAGIGDDCTAIGMQQLVDQIRTDGAGNVIIVPSLGGETNLAGMPALTDPANPAHPQLAYGIHYPNLPIGVSAWDKAFGNFSARGPVIVTEWDGAGITPGCTPGSPAQSIELLAYLASKRIGLVGFSFDLPGTIVNDYHFTPTSYASPFSCSVAGGGPGQILFNDYAAEARASATAPLNGLSSPASWVVSQSAGSHFVSASPTASQLLFNTPFSFVTGTGAAGAGQIGLGNAVPTATFSNEALLAQRVNGNELAPGTVAVQYAPSSPLTPRNQMTDPGNAFRQAAIVAHAHGLLLVGSPSLNVVRAGSPNLKKIKWTSKYLKRRIAAAAGRYSDAYVIQAQSLEQKPNRFAAFVRQAAAQARNAHPSLEILTEVRSGSGAHAPTVPMLQRDLANAGASVAGYMLVDPSAGGAQPADADPAIGLIDSFAGQG
jgi:endoglucanase